MNITPYTTEDAIQNYLLTDIDDTFSTQISEYIDAVSRWMDRYTGRNLIENTSSTKVYSGDGTNLLLIDDVLNGTVTAVTVDGTAITDYILVPTNNPSQYSIQLTEGDVFTEDFNNVSITANFSYRDVLASANDIKFACTVITAGIINAGSCTGQEVKSETIGKYQVVYNTEEQSRDYDLAMDILKSYRVICF